MKYEIRIVRSAEKEITKLPAVIRDKINKSILSLEDSPRPRNAKKLSNREDYRMKIAAYRVLYSIDEKNHIILILAAGHRSDVYRKR